MTAATTKKINSMISIMGYEIVKGDGYFYFVARNDHVDPDGVPSVYTMFLRDLSLEEWVDHVKTHTEGKEWKV